MYFYCMSRLAYPTDLTDAEWLLAEPYVRTSGYGRPPLHSKRELLNALFTNCGQRLALAAARFTTLAHGLQAVRGLARGRHLGPPAPRAAPASAPVNTGAGTERRGHRLAVRAHGQQKGGCHGYDAGKQIGGRKRHIVVDTQGLLLAVLVQAASVQDPVGAAPVLAEAKANAPQLQLLWADARYQGPLVATAATALELRVEVVRAPAGTKGFVVLPRRWVVERSFSWLSKYRRVAADLPPLN